MQHDCRTAASPRSDDADAGDEIRSFIDPERLSEREHKELDFWANDERERPGADFFENVCHKSRFMTVFRHNLDRLGLEGGERVLELGSGHGWASALVKRRFPDCYVVASDVSADALATALRYEGLLDTTIDEKWACTADRLPFADGNFDRVFAFAAFQHVIIGERYRGVLGEVLRVLRPGGRLVMLYEPSAPTWLHHGAKWRVRRGRAVDAVDEDILHLRTLEQACDELNAAVRIVYDPDFLDRPGELQTVYYAGLHFLPLLRRCLPCTVNVEITWSS